MPCKYSPIGPIRILEQLQQTSFLGNYLLLLTHDVLDNEESYVSLLDDVRDFGDVGEKDFVIVDNGVIELGKAMPFEEVVEAANYALAECIVMPDVLGDFQATRQAVMAEMGKMVECDFPIMKVPQGKDLGEVVQCIEWLLQEVSPLYPYRDYWGIPRWIANKLSSRAPVIDYINRVCEAPIIHLLGMSTNWEDDILCAHLPNVIGIDSANPILLGLGGHNPESNEYEHLPRGNYWEKTDIDSNVLENIKYVRQALS